MRVERGRDGQQSEVKGQRGGRKTEDWETGLQKETEGTKSPDRDTAECSLTRLRDKYGADLIKATIRKDRPGGGSTYTLRYFTRETTQFPLF